MTLRPACGFLVPCIPSQRSMNCELTSRRRLVVDAQLQVAELNRVVTGWANYFCLGPVSKAYRAIDTHLVERLRWWLCKKHKSLFGKFLNDKNLL
jgi:hypothetical protein